MPPRQQGHGQGRAQLGRGTPAPDRDRAVRVGPEGGRARLPPRPAWRPAEREAQALGRPPEGQTTRAPPKPREGGAGDVPREGKHGASPRRPRGQTRSRGRGRGHAGRTPARGDESQTAGRRVACRAVPACRTPSRPRAGTRDGDGGLDLLLDTPSRMRTMRPAPRPHRRRGHQEDGLTSGVRRRKQLQHLQATGGGRGRRSVRRRRRWAVGQARAMASPGADHREDTRCVPGLVGQAQPVEQVASPGLGLAAGRRRR